MKQALVGLRDIGLGKMVFGRFSVSFLFLMHYSNQRGRHQSTTFIS